MRRVFTAQRSVSAKVELVFFFFFTEVEWRRAGEGREGRRVKGVVELSMREGRKEGGGWRESEGKERGRREG